MGESSREAGGKKPRKEKIPHVLRHLEQGHKEKIPHVLRHLEQGHKEGIPRGTEAGFYLVIERASNQVILNLKYAPNLREARYSGITVFPSFVAAYSARRRAQAENRTCQWVCELEIVQLKIK